MPSDIHVGRRYSKDRTLVVDDTPSCFQRNYGNAIRIEAWMGDPRDDELMLLANYLKKLLTSGGSWRRISKLNWRSELKQKESSAEGGSPPSNTSVD